MLRGTTLGWALEAGSNRLWVAGWRLWLPVLLVLDAVVWQPLWRIWLFGTHLRWGTALGDWPASRGPWMFVWYAGVFDVEPALLSPAGYLAIPSLVSVPVGIACGVLWALARRRGRPGWMRPFGRSRLVLHLAILSTCMPLLLYFLGQHLNSGSGLRPPSTAVVAALQGAWMSAALVAGTAITALTLWCAFSPGDSRALVRVTLASAFLLLAREGASYVQDAAYLQSGGTDATIPRAVGVTTSTLYWVLFPVVLGAALRGAAPMLLLRRWPTVLGLVLLAFGVQVMRSLTSAWVPPVLSLGPSSTWLDRTIDGAPTILWVGPALSQWAIEAAALCCSLALACAIGELGCLGRAGEAGEDAAPVDAAPAQQQP